MNLEPRRKRFHSLFGLVLILILFYFERKILIIFLSLLLLFGSIMIVWRLRGNRIPIADWFEETFERKNVRFPGYGAFWYVVSTLLLALFISNASEITAAILTLSLGYSAATIFGIMGIILFPIIDTRQSRALLRFSFFLFLLAYW